MTTAPIIKRTYGNERNFGDVLYNPQTKSVFCNIELGFFGRTTLTLSKREDGGFDLLKNYKDKNGQEQVITLGKTFPAKRKDGTIVEGVTKGTLGLLKRFDKELGKNITDNSDALFITTHKLKENQKLGESNFVKIGFISGQFGIENQEQSNNAETQVNIQNDIDMDDIPEDQIPF